MQGFAHQILPCTEKKTEEKMLLPSTTESTVLFLCLSPLQFLWNNLGHILHDFSPTSNASTLVVHLQLENLQSRRMSDKVCMMYTIMNGLVDVNPAAGLLEPRNHSSREHKYQLQVPHSRTRWVPTFLLPMSNPTLELCPHRCSISSDSTCLQSCTDELAGRTCLTRSGSVI